MGKVSLNPTVSAKYSYQGLECGPYVVYKAWTRSKRCLWWSWRFWGGKMNLQDYLMSMS